MLNLWPDVNLAAPSSLLLFGPVMFFTLTCINLVLFIDILSYKVSEGPLVWFLSSLSIVSLRWTFITAVSCMCIFVRGSGSHIGRRVYTLFCHVYYPFSPPFSYVLMFFYFLLFLSISHLLPSMLHPFPLFSKFPNITSVHLIFVFSLSLIFSVTSYYSPHSSPSFPFPFLPSSSFPYFLPLFLDFHDRLLSSPPM